VSWFGPHVMAMAALTTGIGVVMSQIGRAKGILHERALRRHCPCCGRLLSARGCERCGF